MSSWGWWTGHYHYVDDISLVQGTAVVTPVLTVSLTGNGDGVVTADPAGTVSGVNVFSYPVGTRVTLTATPSSGSTFSGWSGACSGVESCQLTMDMAKTVTAIFDDLTPPDSPIVSSITLTKDPMPTWTWDSRGGSGTFRYKLDNNDLTIGATETTALSYMPEIALSDGTHTLYVQECDVAGNWSTSGSFTITIDTIAPAVTVVENQTMNGLFTQTATGTDANAMTYAWSKQAGPGEVAFGTATGLSTTIAASLDGTYTIRFTATDAAGNISFRDMTLVWDTVAPVTTASPEGGAYIDSKSVTLSANEPSTIYYTTDGTAPSESSSVYSAPISISETTTLKFFAKDQAGNSEGVKEIFYNIKYVSSGDINADGTVDLSDAVMAMQVLSGIPVVQPVCKSADVNGDGKIGIADVIYIIQKSADLRYETNAAYSISGIVTDGSKGLSGVTMTVIAGSALVTVFTDSDGGYDFNGIPSGNYLLSPSLAGYTFTPASISVSVNGSNAVAQDFKVDPFVKTVFHQN
jgi:hypothetical protein